MRMASQNFTACGRTAVILAVLFATQVHGLAVGDYPPYLRDCVESDGKPIQQDECELGRKLHDRQATEQANAMAQRAAALSSIQAEAQAAAIARTQREARWAAEREARQVASDAEQAARRQRLLDDERTEASRERDAVAKKKATCGDDYLAPKIGMSIERAKQCVSPSLRVFGQVNRADGVVTIYRTGSGATFHAMNGVIVAWNR